jgi:hypothetical protein
MAPPVVRVFFWRGPVKEKEMSLFGPAHSQKKMRFDIASELARLREIHAALWPPGPHLPRSAGPQRGSAGPQRPQITALSEAHMHHTRGGARGARGHSGPSGPLKRFDIASELDGVPRKHNPYGYVWTAPRYSLITHAAFRACNGKPDVIDLYSEAPLTGGRVLRFKVPFVHTTSGTFFRRRRP